MTVMNVRVYCIPPKCTLSRSIQASERTEVVFEIPEPIYWLVMENYRGQHSFPKVRAIRLGETWFGKNEKHISMLIRIKFISGIRVRQ